MIDFKETRKHFFNCLREWKRKKYNKEHKKMNKKQLRQYSFLCLKAWKNTRWYKQDKKSCSLVLSILKKINKCKFDSGINFIDLDYFSYNGYKLLISANSAIIEFDVREEKIFHLRVFNKLNKQQHGLNDLKFKWLNKELQ